MPVVGVHGTSLKGPLFKKKFGSSYGITGVAALVNNYLPHTALVANRAMQKSSGGEALFLVFCKDNHICHV